MRRPVRVLCALGATVAAAFGVAACGTQRIEVPTSKPALHAGAEIFQQRCSGCHSLSYAATFGSAANVFTAEFNNGPNFNVRCERPAIRVLYAIENGGFSGAIMPANIVVGKDAIDVAKFVATYSGRQAPLIPGQTRCQQKAIGSIPSPLAAASTSTSTTPKSATKASTHSASKHSSKHSAGKHSSKTRHS